MSKFKRKMKYFVAITDNGKIVFETNAITKQEAIKALLKTKPHLFPIVTFKNIKNCQNKIVNKTL